MARTTYLTPGVYIEEPPPANRPIAGVGTAVAAFFGFAQSGPVNEPTAVNSWSDYIRTFGMATNNGQSAIDPHIPDAYLSHAVYGYFLNGGGKCYVTRLPFQIAEGARPVSLQLTDKASNKPLLAFKHRDISDKPVSIQIEHEPPPPAPEGPPPEGGTPRAADPTFKVRVMKEGAEPEIFAGVTAKTLLKELERSKLVAVEVEGKQLATIPDSGVYTLEANKTLLPTPVEAKVFIGDETDRSGIQGIAVHDDVTMICVPDLMSPLAYKDRKIDLGKVQQVQAALMDFCTVRRCMAILDAPPDEAGWEPGGVPGTMAPQKIRDWRRDTARYDSMFGALYYPWITIEKTRERQTVVPPCGHVAGVYANTDNTRGVHKAPANEVIRGVIEPARMITDREQESLNPDGINCIRAFTGRGVRIWGARTLTSDAAWRYINVRRLFNYVERSIEVGTQWAVFEPNDYDLWARVKRDITAFLTVTWRAGMLFGRSPEQAFYVKCDEETNPPETRDLGLLIVEIGIAPVKPAEFVVFRFSQIAGGG